MNTEPFPTRYQRWEAMRALDQEEKARIAFLNTTPAPNPPELVAPVLVGVLRSFCVGGRRQEAGGTIELQRFDAESLAAIGRCVVL